MKIKILAGFLLLVGLVLPTYAQEKTFTCINENGYRVFSVKAKWVGRFSNGMAEAQRLVLVNNKPVYRSGFIDETGKMVIAANYEKVYDFKFGVTWVKEPGAGGYYLINKQGDKLTDRTWKQVGYFFDGHCAVYDDNDKMGFVNREGKLVIPCKYTGDSFSEGLACVMPFDLKEPNYGFIDTTGKIVIPFQYKQAGTSSFINGECRVQMSGVTCLINKKGEVVFKPKLCNNTQGFYYNLSAGYTNYSTRTGWGFYTRNNQWVVKPQYDNATSFEGGLAIVEKGGKQGVIDTTGRLVIPVKYASIFGSGTDGYFGVTLDADGKKEYLSSTNGKPFTEQTIKFLLPANGHSLYPYCDEKDRYGYLKIDGTVFMEPQFESAGTFYEGKAWVKGETSRLRMAPGSSADWFVKEYAVGDKVISNWKGEGDFYPGTISQIKDGYYLVKYDDGAQEWVTYDSLRSK